MIDIRNRADFALVLDATIAEVDSLVISEPGYRIWAMLQQQLHALKEWSSTPTAPSADRLNAISIGRIAARELEPTNEPWMQDLIDRLHLLNYFWRHWLGAETPARKAPWSGLRKLALASIASTLVLAFVVGGSLLALRSVARTATGPATPLGQPISIPGATATLTVSLEPYTISLRHNPEGERHQVQLQLSDPTHKQPDRIIPIAQHLQYNDLRFDAKLLGDDGHRLWFYVGKIGAWDYRQDRLVDPDDLRRANPTLGMFKRKSNRGDPLISPAVARIDQPALDLWSGEGRLYGFDGRLRVTTPDYQNVYEIDPESLHASVK